MYPWEKYASYFRILIFNFNQRHIFTKMWFVWNNFETMRHQLKCTCSKLKTKHWHPTLWHTKKYQFTPNTVAYDKVSISNKDNGK